MAAMRPVWSLPTLDAAESAGVHEFVDSSLRLFAALNDCLISAHGLSLFEVLMLEMLGRSVDTSARMSDLATAFALTRSRVTQLIDRLERQGLVARSPHPTDRRAVLASITGHGLEQLQRAVATYAQAIRAHYLDPMSRQQAIALGDVCRRAASPQT